MDLVASPDGRTVYVKDNRGLVVIDAPTWKVRQELKFSAGGSGVHGIVVTRDGSRIYATTSQDILWEIKVMPDGNAELGASWFTGTAGSGNPVPAGHALSADEKTAYVCLSRNNSLGIIDLVTGRWLASVSGHRAADVALFADGKRFANWAGGIRARASTASPLRDAQGRAAWRQRHGFTADLIRTARWRRSSRAFIRRTSS